MSAHPNQHINKVNVKLDERSATLGERLSGYARSFGSSSSHDYTSESYTDKLKNYASGASDKLHAQAQPSTMDKLNNLLSSYKDKILSNTMSKEQLAAAVGAEPTLMEKIQRAVTGHPTDAERAQGAVENKLDSTGLKSYLSEYYDSVKSGAYNLRSKAEQLAGTAQAEVEPSLLEKIQYKLTGHPTAAERAAGAANNLADKYGVKEQAYASAEKAREAAVELQNKAGDALEPTLMEKIQQKLTGHPTDAERVQGAAKDLADSYDISGKASAAKDTVYDKLGVHEPSLTDKIKSSLGFREPTLSEKLSAAANDLQLRASELLHSEPSTSEKLSAAATDLQSKAKEALGIHEDSYSEKLQHYVQDLQAKAKSALSMNEPSTSEKLQAAADSLSGKVKSTLGMHEASTSEKLSAKAHEYQQQANDAINAAKTKLQGEQHQPSLTEKVKVS